mmetsp:Transcript_21543/g.35643  ORF Transcript_21543/g.35643 Transcript_21543/m.35643 type:complete len:115 (-) Transcript_21543:237-581(-)|eukprot:CAMPEP_0119012464 /NCGR_PEP_ID=MMETSP1176-20130426/6742_1 /TAXON_ID=265551 /ORGANISM="Synedropsis recta cf, Strain CCMP1620" /LENGTH=114 /DNA_ID=CAMNT_0006965423 /DNA_START=80 /DNA_END=424 /DNA_ORIENTATION=+
MVSATAISSILLLFAGVTAVFFVINRQEHVAKESNRVATPMIGMVSAGKEGPWPKCVGMDGTKCCNLIEGHAKDVRGNCVVVPQYSMVTMDFSTTRVRVFVDEDSVVTRIPDRG